MAAAAYQLDPNTREFLASLPPGTVIAQLADGSLAICHTADEADEKIVASRAEKESKSRPTRRRPEPPPRRASTFSGPG
jgi:hypothetical protein